MLRIGIIGAGPTGLTAGYELSKLGCDITIFESDSKCGGLVSSVKVGNQNLEAFYHHIFNSDVDLIDLINELGLEKKLLWLNPSSGLYINNKVYPFTSPVDLLKFQELSFFERISMGLLLYKAKFIKNWSSLEDITAKEWIIKNSGENVYEKVWGPLLASKFDVDFEKISAVWIWNKFKLRGSTRSKGISKEMLGYLKGSFAVLYEALLQNILDRKGKILFEHKVENIKPNEDGTVDIYSNGKAFKFDKVLVTTAPNLFKKMQIPFNKEYYEKVDKIKYKANICMILELKEKVSPYYWTTVAQKGYPFVLVVEHTNFMPKEEYGVNIVYLSRYLDASSSLYKESDEKIEKIFIKFLEKMFPSWDKSNIINIHLNRVEYSQPIVYKNYSNIRLDYITPIKNIYIANMSHIYPEDRGQNYAVKLGRDISKIIIKKLI